MKRLFESDPWLIRTNQLHVEDLRLQESLTAIGNGYMGMRGNFEEGYSGDHLQGTYLGGVWFPDKTRVGWWKNGYPEYFGKVINAPSFIGIRLTINGETIDLATTDYSDFSMTLDLHQGLLTRSFVVRVPDASVRLSFSRFLSVKIKEAAYIELYVDVLEGHADVRAESMLDGQVVNTDSNYEEHFWLPQRESAASRFIQLKTKPNPFAVPQFTVLLQQRLRVNDEPAEGLVTTASGQLSETLTVKLVSGESWRLEKDVVVVTSRDIEPALQKEAATNLMRQARETTFASALADHTALWAERWEHCDVIIEGDAEAQQGIRFNIAQLFMTYYGDDARLNVGPKGFTGEKYGGATYWDTEAYVVPMYLAVAPPEVTRNLLQYRHDQLPGAFHNARQQGLAGALYPMVTFNGIECHNEWEITFEEIHRNAAIANAIRMYTDYTGDTSYVENDGMAVLVGIARFWADRVHFSQNAQKYMIHGVTGPNEYENNVNNNWYTNTMASWCLEYALERLPLADSEAQAALNVSGEERAHWQDIIDRMYLGEDTERGIFIQNDNFLDKDLAPVSAIPAEERPINQHWSWDKILRSPYIKQADVLQGIYFLNDRFTLAQKQANFDFYEPMTVHESSLSPSVHAILAAELGKTEKAVEMYARTARLDLDNYNNDTDDGLHITSMTGSWLAIVQGFAGMRYDHNQLRFKPFCPENWKRYAFKFQYRGRLIDVEVSHEGTTIRLLSGEGLDVQVNDAVQHLEVGTDA